MSSRSKRVFFGDFVFVVDENVYEPAEDTFLLAENLDVNGGDIVRKQARIAQRFQRPLVHPTDWQDHTMTNGLRRRTPEFFQRETVCQSLIVAVNEQKDGDQHG